MFRQVTWSNVFFDGSNKWKYDLSHVPCSLHIESSPFFLLRVLLPSWFEIIFWWRERLSASRGVARGFGCRSRPRIRNFWTNRSSPSVVERSSRHTGVKQIVASSEVISAGVAGQKLRHDQLMCWFDSCAIRKVSSADDRHRVKEVDRQFWCRKRLNSSATSIYSPCAVHHGAALLWEGMSAFFWSKNAFRICRFAQFSSVTQKLRVRKRTPYLTHTRGWRRLAACERAVKAPEAACSTLLDCEPLFFQTTMSS